MNNLDKNTLITANLGNSLPAGRKFTFSLFDKELVELIKKKILKLQPEICVFQEIWTFSSEILDNNYDYIGENDSIAVKKSFGKILKETYKSNSFKFKKHVDAEVFPLKNIREIEDHKEKLKKIPYKGNLNSDYGIPADFDISSVIVKKKDGRKIMIANVHLESNPLKDDIRALQLKNWLMNDILIRAESLCDNRILIGGDFNHDYYKNQNSKTSKVLKDIIRIYNLNDAISSTEGKLKSTLNYPLVNRNVDHILGTALFDNYQINQSILDEDLKFFMKKHRLSWWLYLDHKQVSVDFMFT